MWNRTLNIVNFNHHAFREFSLPFTIRLLASGQQRTRAVATEYIVWLQANRGKLDEWIQGRSPDRLAAPAERRSGCWFEGTACIVINEALPVSLSRPTCEPTVHQFAHED
jgi:hypothetical protein